MNHRYEHKLAEANYFYIRMVEFQNNIDHFWFNFSAFLSAARSVLQYGAEETDNGKNKNAQPKAQKWYQRSMKDAKTFSHFKDVRDDNIHASPAYPRAVVKVTFLEKIGCGEALLIDSNGVGKPTVQIEKGPDVKRVEVPIEVSHKYTFDNWSGPEDVIELCKIHLDELRCFVKEGIEAGHIIDK